jgi:hypothetical protein
MKISRYNNFILESADSIESICERYNITNYTINEDGSIDVDGDVKIYGKRLTKLPLKFRRVTGWFSCYNNKLTSLEGCPKEVGGNFECYGNKLTSLEGSPKSVGRTFDCSYNKLTNLVGGPEVVLGDYYADTNQINSFEGFPDDFKGEVYFGRHLDLMPYNPVQKVLNQFPEEMYVKVIHLINDYDAIWNGEVIEERLEMVKEKLGLV